MQKVASKALGVLLVLCMLLGLFPAAAMAADAPSDISGHWAQRQLQSFVDDGYLEGYEDGTYRPNDKATRAEFSALMNRVAGLTQESADIQKFEDVSANRWYYADLAKGLAAGYLAGTTPTTMEPNASATREQAFAMLARLLKMTDGDTAVLARFSDGGSVSRYARGCIAALVSAGIVSGYPDGTLLPQGTLTRAEAVMILYNCKSLLQGEEPPSGLKDGVYTGTGTGYGGELTVTVTVSGGRITAIEIGENKETEIYLNSAKAVIDQIIANQGTDGVDAVSGATYSSYGIINAVKDALKDAASQTAETIEVTSWKEFVDALASAKDGDTVKLTEDITNAGDVIDATSSATPGVAKVNRSITIDGNQHSITKGDDTAFCFEIGESASHGGPADSEGGRGESGGKGGNAASNGRAKGDVEGEQGSGSADSKVTVTIKALTIDGASYEKKMGGAMYTQEGAVLNLESVTFRNCAAENTGMFTNGGGALYVGGGTTVTASNCTFVNNRVGTDDKLNGRGGAVYAVFGSTVVLDGCTFSENQADYGGAVAAMGTNVSLTVKNCTFEGSNNATYGGNDIYIFDGYTYVKKGQALDSAVTAEIIGNTYKGVESDDYTSYRVVRGSVLGDITDTTSMGRDSSVAPEVEEGVIDPETTTVTKTGCKGAGGVFTAGWALTFAPTAYDRNETPVEAVNGASAYTYLLMNIPYADFYAAEVENDVAVDAVSSATKAKTMSGSLVAGSYHVNADGSDITGIIYPVAVPADADLSACKQITDADSLEITVTNRGQTTTTVYEGKDALFGNPSYSYYVLTEAPSNYKILSVGADGAFSFSKAQGVVTKTSDVTASFMTESSYGDFQLNLVGFDAVSEDTVYGVFLTAADGSGYGLRHLENVWLKTQLAWATGFTTAVHGSPTSSEHYVSMMGKTITSVTYITSSGIYEIPVEIYVPVKFANDLAVVDAAVMAKSTSVSVTLPEAFEPSLTVLDASGNDVTESYGFALDAGKLTWKTEPLPAVYTVNISDAKGVYLAVSATCTLSSNVVPAAYNAETRSLVAADGSSAEAFANYLSALKEIKVNGVSNKVEVPGRHGTTITYTTVVNKDGTIALDGGMFTEMEAGKQYEVVATATAYTEPLTFTVTIPETLYGTATLTFAEFYSGDVSSTDGYGVDGVSSATVGKYNSFNGNMDTNYTEDKTEGYNIYGVKNVNVAVSANDFDAFKALENDFAYTGITAPSQYKTVTAVENGKAVYSATAFNKVATVTDATATLKTGSTWGDYEIDVTETSTKYIRNNRSDEGWAVNANIQGIILETEAGYKVGMEYLQSIWVQPWEVSFNVSADSAQNAHIAKWDNIAELSKLVGQKVTSITYIMPDGVYVYTFDGIYIKPVYAGENTIQASFTEGSAEVAISGVPTDLENVTVTISYGAGRQSKTVANAAAIVDGKVTMTEAYDSTQTYAVKVSSSNYADIVVALSMTAQQRAQIEALVAQAAALFESNEAAKNDSGLNEHYEEALELLADENATASEAAELISELTGHLSVYVAL